MGKAAMGTDHVIRNHGSRHGSSRLSLYLGRRCNVSVNIGSMIGMIAFAAGIAFVWAHPIGIMVVVTGLCAFGWLLCLASYMDF